MRETGRRIGKGNEGSYDGSGGAMVTASWSEIWWVKGREIHQQTQTYRKVVRSVLLEELNLEDSRQIDETRGAWDVD